MNIAKEPPDAGGDEDQAAASAASRRSLQRIRRTLTRFSWSNYGLDAVEDANSKEWATDLAAEIHEALSKP